MTKEVVSDHLIILLTIHVCSKEPIDKLMISLQCKTTRLTLNSSVHLMISRIIYATNKILAVNIQMLISLTRTNNHYIKIC